MSVWRYQTCERVEIDAPIERVYAVASDPERVPVYAPEIARIDLLKRLSDHTVLARSHIKFAWLTVACTYRYHYRPPAHYSGVQEGRGLLRGYFSLAFRQRGGRTVVSHAEGVLSPVPLLAWAAGFVYFRLLARGRMGDELGRLKSLVEGQEP